MLGKLNMFINNMKLPRTDDAIIFKRVMRFFYLGRTNLSVTFAA